MVEEYTVLCIQCPLSIGLCPSYLNKKEQSRKVLELEPFTELRQALEEWFFCQAQYPTDGWAKQKRGGVMA